MQEAPREISTNRLTLRPPVLADRGHWVRMQRDPALYGEASWAMPPSDEAASRAFDECVARWSSGGADYGIVEETSRRARVGLGGLSRTLVAGDDVLDLLCALLPEVQGRGLGREAARAWTAHALEWLPDLPVVAVVDPANARSRHTALAAGLEPAGEVEVGPPGTPPSVLLRAPRVEAREWFDDHTREQVLDLWCAVNDDGGAVGFLPGAERHRVAAALAAHEEEMADGLTTAVLLRSAGGSVVGLGFWVADRNPLLGHSRTAFRIMTDPTRRGRNLGRLLLAAMHRVARRDGVELATLVVRSGTGATRFYEHAGYVEVGRVPGNVRVAAGDDRDSVYMARRLDHRAMVADGRA